MTALTALQIKQLNYMNEAARKASLGTRLNALEVEGDVTTPGTVEASKAAVVDANKDISGFRNVGLTGTLTPGAIAGADSALDVAGIAGSAGSAGGTVDIVGGAGDGTGAGGAVGVTGGASGAGATGNGGAASVVGGAAASTDGVGGLASVTGGAGRGTGNGGAGRLIGGASGAGATGNGGAIAVTGGASLATNGTGGAVVATGGVGKGTGDGGAVSLTGGAAPDTGTGGAASLVGGAATAGAGGAIAVTGGAGGATGAGGVVTVTGGASGAGATGNGGAASLVGGAAASTDGNGGAANITGGVGRGTGTGGGINLTTGASAGAGGTAGSVAIDSGSAAGGTAGTVTIGGTNASNVSIGRTGGTVDLRGVALTVAPEELNMIDGQPSSASTFVIGAEGGDVINVGIQLKDALAVDLATRASLMAYLSNDANGDSVCTNAPNGGCAIGTDGLLIPVTPAITNALILDGNLAISAVPEKFKTTQTAVYTVNGISYTKAATDNLVFSDAHVISATKFGVIRLQINAAGTISSKVPVSPQAYNDAPTALAALPAVDAGNVSLGYIAIEAGVADWTANTSDMTNGSDLATAAFNDSTEVTQNAAAKMFQLTSESDGDIDINISETGAVTFYLVLVLPNGLLKVSDAITFA